MVVYTRIHLVIVSIHTPTQGVTTSIMYPAQASQFQSTHPRRVWPFCTFAMCSEYVSIHTPTQGVTAATIFCSEFNKFQSTHPRRVWPSHKWQDPRHTSFNPHTHAGCDRTEARQMPVTEVSIHTPTQGVTLSSTKLFSSLIVSIHTPTQGVTLTTFVFFESHRVSIHTPTQGVTALIIAARAWAIVSIHTPTQGVTKLAEATYWLSEFQSTHPRRVWLWSFRSLDPCNCFNPHTHAGCDDDFSWS